MKRVSPTLCLALALTAGATAARADDDGATAPADDEAPSVAPPRRVAAVPRVGPTSDAVVDEAPDAILAEDQPWIRPFAAVVGGFKFETLDNAPGDTREGRFVTVALSRFGLRAGVARGITIESEFEANAGPHGSSA